MKLILLYVLLLTIVLIGVHFVVTLFMLEIINNVSRMDLIRFHWDKLLGLLITCLCFIPVYIGLAKEVEK